MSIKSDIDEDLSEIGNWALEVSRAVAKLIVVAGEEDDEAIAAFNHATRGLQKIVAHADDLAHPIWTLQQEAVEARAPSPHALAIADMRHAAKALRAYVEGKANKEYGRDEAETDVEMIERELAKMAGKAKS